MSDGRTEDGHTKNVSKTLSFWLRHRPDAGRLALDQAGWTDIPSVLEALARAGLPARVEDLQGLVASSDKQRFELSSDGARIRARQGHSVAVELDWPVADPPETLFHGTVTRSLPPILAHGLSRMKRHHVHLSPDVRTARAIGGRRGTPVILQVAAARMAAAGHVFHLTSNKVWLTDRVPPEFLTVLDSAGTGGAGGS